MSLDVGSIVVSGALRAGGPDCRLASHLTLTFRALPGLDAFNMVGGGGPEWVDLTAVCILACTPCERPLTVLPCCLCAALTCGQCHRW